MFFFRINRWVLFSIQLELRGDTSEYHLDGLGTNCLLSCRSATLSNIVKKGSKQVQLTFMVEGLKVGSNSGEFDREPLSPNTEKTQPFTFG